MSTDNYIGSANPRQQRGAKIANKFRIRQDGPVWLVPSESSDTTYTVDPAAGSCDCPDHTVRGVRCKHQWAVEFTTKREIDPDGRTTITESYRVTYSQEWTSYNAAQTHEHEHFIRLLQDLCTT